MKWLVTGGCGFIGTNAVLGLRSAGDEVVVLDNLRRPLVERNMLMLQTEHDVECHVMDIRNANDVRRLWGQHSDADAVLHLAGQVSLLASISDPRYDFETNALGTFNVLEATRDLIPDAALLYASTNKVYGDLVDLRVEETDTRYVLPDHPHGLGEELPLDFHGGYGCSKGAADQYVLDFARTYGLRSVSLRQSSVYGGHQYATADQGWIAYFAKVGVLGEHYAINGNGKQVRDALHVDDLTALYRACVEAIDGCAGEAFNVGGGPGNSASLVELFELLRSDYGFAMTYDEGPPRPGDQKVFVADIRKVADRTGWQPTVGLRQGLEGLVAWTRSAFAPEGTPR
jgi:CDP-paratose 2-epimerase